MTTPSRMDAPNIGKQPVTFSFPFGCRGEQVTICPESGQDLTLINLDQPGIYSFRIKHLSWVKELCLY